MGVDLPESALQDPAEALREARGQVDEASAEVSSAGITSGSPFSKPAEAGQAPADNPEQAYDYPPTDPQKYPPTDPQQQ